MPMQTPPRSAQQQEHLWQEDQIRRTTRALGFDPLALPAGDQGRNVVKSLIRARCGKNHPVTLRATLFNQAWERMLTGHPPGLQYSAV